MYFLIFRYLFLRFLSKLCLLFYFFEYYCSWQIHKKRDCFFCVFIKLFILMDTSLRLNRFFRPVNVLRESLWNKKNKNDLFKFEIYNIVFKMTISVTEITDFSINAFFKVIIAMFLFRISILQCRVPIFFFIFILKIFVHLHYVCVCFLLNLVVLIILRLPHFVYPFAFGFTKRQSRFTVDFSLYEILRLFFQYRPQ